MRTEIELSFSGLNHANKIHRYDEGFGAMVRGFQFRVRPLFVVIVWKKK